MQRFIVPIVSIVAAAAFATTGCLTEEAGEADAEVGEVELDLVGQSASGNVYRLRDATLDILAGNGVVVQSFDVEANPDAPSIVTRLTGGPYALALQPGWQLERVTANGTVPVVAALSTANPLPFQVVGAGFTAVQMRFSVAGDQVGMGEGDVDISIGVDEPPVIPIASVGALNVTEGGTAAFSVTLDRAPMASATIQLYSFGHVQLSPTALVFDPSNWNLPQVVTFVALEDDDVLDGFDYITIYSSSVSTQVQVQILDNDFVTNPEIHVDTTSFILTEGHTGSTFMRLSGPPASPVTVSISSSDPSAVVASPSAITFDASNWNLGQFLVIDALDDADMEDEFVALTLSAPGIPGYNLSAQVRDDDVQSIVVSTSSIAMAELGTANFSVGLAFQPLGTVVVDVLAPSPFLDANPSSLVFTPANWFTPQTVSLNALFDGNFSDDTTSVMLSAPGVPTSTVDVAIDDVF